MFFIKSRSYVKERLNTQVPATVAALERFYHFVICEATCDPLYVQQKGLQSSVEILASTYCEPGSVREQNCLKKNSIG